jgi:hypothetical protein
MGNLTHMMGMKFEVSNLQVFKDNGFGKYIKFSNPLKNFWSYCKHSGEGKGVDMVMVIGAFWLYIEESFCSHYYRYHQRWWNLCREERFKQYPNDKFHKQIVLTNRAENFKSTSTGSITVHSIHSLLVLIQSLIALLPSNNTNYNTNTHIGMVEQYSIYDVRNPQHELWMNREMNRLEKLSSKQ